MDKCTHINVQSWVFEDGAPALFWSCVECGHKFAPIDIQQEEDAARYRHMRDNAYIFEKHVEADKTPSMWLRHDVPTDNDSIDAAIDKAMKADRDWSGENG